MTIKIFETSIKRIQYHTLMMIQKFFRTLPNPINAQKIFFQTFMNTFNKTESTCRLGRGTVGVRGILCVRTGGAGGTGPPHLFEIGAIRKSWGKPCVNLKISSNFLCMIPFLKSFHFEVEKRILILQWDQTILSKQIAFF